MSRRWILLLLITACVLLSGCASLGLAYEKPALSLVNVRSLGGSGLEQRFALSFRVDNPNPVALPIRGIDYEVGLNGLRFASGATDRDFTIAANGNSVFDVEVRADLLNTARVLTELFRERRDRVDYNLDARIHTGVPLLGAVDVGRRGTVSLGG